MLCLHFRDSDRSKSLLLRKKSKDGVYLSDVSINIGYSNTVAETPSNNKECYYDETIPPTNGYNGCLISIIVLNKNMSYI